jgi:flagellar export protein FliJ
MRRFRFSLEPLLEFRAFRLRDAENALSAKAGLVRLMELELERIGAEEARTRSGRFQGGRGILDFIADERYLQRLSGERERGTLELARRECERDEALKAYNDANKEKKVLEKLEEGELESYAKEASRREILEIDDIVSGKRAREGVAQAREGVARSSARKAAPRTAAAAVRGE